MIEKETIAIKPVNKSLIIISLVLFDDGGSGHHYGYAKSVGNAARLLGLNHFAAVSKNFAESELDSNWSACLDCCRHPGNQKVKNVIVRGLTWLFSSFTLLLWSVTKYLQSQTARKEKVVILLESFGVPELIALTISLCFLPRNNLCVWLFYRYDNYKHWLIGRMYKLLNGVIRKLTSGRIILLTDSELLAYSLSTYFQMPVTVMPIPHTVSSVEGKFEKPNNQILAWWPGRAKKKGFEFVKTLAHTINENAQSLRIIAWENSEIFSIPGGPNVQLIKSPLSQLEYFKWMSTVDIVLLPYDANAFREQTSGIFTESICAGKLCAVSGGTWMAAELRKYDLEELIISDRENTIPWLLQIAKDSKIQAKILRMQAEYQNYHSEKGFAKAMELLLETI